MDDDFVQLEFAPFDQAVKTAQAGDARLSDLTLSGGSGRGWSRYSTLQRCARAFQYTYVGDNPQRAAERAPIIPLTARNDDNLSIGSGVHALLAIYYLHGRDVASSFWNRLVSCGIDPFVRDEVWRLYSAYIDFYGDRDYIVPLAAEARAVNEETGDTCRYDLICRIDSPPLGELPGFYILEHKTAWRFDQTVLDGWDIDGEVLGEYAFWKLGGFEEKYGPLNGIIVNIIGKQKEPKFHRVFVTPSQYQIDEHLSSLAYFREYEYNLMKLGYYPRSTAGCMTRYGACSFYDRCRTA